MKDDIILKVDNLKVSFSALRGKNCVVDDVSFDLRRGKTLGIVGESGSGKTMTCLSLMNLIPFYGGEIEGGKIKFSTNKNVQIDILSLSEEDMTAIRGRRIGMIFQEPTASLNPNQRCGQQVEEVLKIHGLIPEENAESLVLKLLQDVGLEDPLRISKAFPHQISGGQLQRVMIAIAIACNPDILIADEPTTALDVTIQSEIISLIKKIIAEKGISCIFVSHDLGVIKEIADEVMVMRLGKIVETGKIDQVFNHPQHPYTQGLMACRPPIHRRIARLHELDDFIGESNRENREIVEVTDEQYEEQLAKVMSNDIVLNIEELSKSYSNGSLFRSKKNKVDAVSSVSLVIRKGEVHGLVGESGCGKSTLARCIVMLEKWNRGLIEYKGVDINTFNSEDKREFRKKVQMIFQDPFTSLNPRMKVGESIMEPIRQFGMFNSKEERVAHIKGIFERVGLNSDHFYRYPHQFSGGEKQRVSIARALAMDPEFLICDEPVSALDVSIQAQILNLLTSLKEEFNLSILFISHDLSVVKFMCDNVSIMSDGRIIESGDVESIFQSPQDSYTKKLLSSIPASDLQY